MDGTGPQRLRKQQALGGARRSRAAYERGARHRDGFIFAAPGAAALEAWARTRFHLAELGRSEAEFGRELLTIFARDADEAADHPKMWRDAGGARGCVQSTGKGLGSDIDAHINYVAQLKRRLDAG